MNDSELKARLRNAPVPERPDEYWDDFPGRVRIHLNRERSGSTPARAWRPRLAWAGGFALAMFLCIQFHALQHASDAITKHEQQLHTQMAKIQSGLQLLMFNPHGMGYLLADAN